MELIREAARRWPAGAALDTGGGDRSWADMDVAVREAARALAEAGVGPGGRVAVEDPRTERSWIRLHAVLGRGATVVPVHEGWTAPERDSALRGLAVDRALDDEEGVRVLREPVGFAGGAPPAALLWTSGTSGRPRGVAVGREALMHVASASARRLALRASDRWYAALSPAHVGGLALLVRAAALGSCSVLRSRFDPSELLGLAAAGRVTHASLVPTMLRRLLAAGGGRPAPPALRVLLVGGAHAPADLVEEALELGYPVALTYGLTEASSQVTTAPPDLVRRKPDTAGAPLEGVHVRIEVEEGREGDGTIAVRGPTVSPGTVDPEDPARLVPVSDPDGWLRTDDLGRLDPDGHLRVLGRAGARIITGGVNVDPREVEEALQGLPGVADAAVVGLPDPEWGEIVAALVVPAPGAQGPALEPLREALRERLAAPKLPRRVRSAEALPRNANGKVDPAAVRRLLEA